MHRFNGEYTSEIRENMKGGTGKVRFEHIWKKNSNEEMWSSCRMFSRITLHPGDSVGIHSHSGEEEIFYILSGRARAWDNGEWIELSPGDCTMCRDGEEHSMECIGDEPCTYLAVIPVYHEAAK